MIKNKKYDVHTWFPDKRYRSACGIETTMYNNNVVLTHPGVNQYLVSKDNIQSRDTEI